MEYSLNSFSKANKIRKELIEESRGSFGIVQRALEEATKAKENASDPLDIEDVKQRIRKLVIKPEAA